MGSFYSSCSISHMTLNNQKTSVLLLASILDFFKSKEIDGCIPEVITGKDIYEYFNFQSVLEENYFFNNLCYSNPLVLKVNPGDVIMSENWIDNRYGLNEPYLTQIRREVKLESILNDK